MPAVRLSRRRKSSHAIFSSAKPGIYGISSRPVTFAPNVTPVSYTELDPLDDPEQNPLSALALAGAAQDASAGPNVKALNAKLFPPSHAATTTTGAQPRKRCPPGKRRSQGYIPRPPNAFMLFRAAFVKQKHIPGSIDTNHGSLSKIIGNCWRQLSLEEKRTWEVKAKQEKAAHKAMFPDYRFRPVHNKNKNLPGKPSSNSNFSDSKDKQPSTAEDERRCEDLAQFLLQGKNGDELALAMRDRDRARELERARQEHEQFEVETIGLEGGYGLDFGSQSRRPSFDFDFNLGLATTSSHHMSRDVSPNATGPTLHMPSSHSLFGMGMSFQPHSFGALNSNANAGFHRRSSSVPLPNEWLATYQDNSFLAPLAGPSSGGIALPTVPFMSRPASPVGSIARFNQQQQLAHTQEFNFAPVPPSAHSQAGFATPSISALSAFSQRTTQQNNQQQPHLFHPTPQISPNAFTFPFAGMTGTSSRASFGLGQRRASSVGSLRSWMPFDFSFNEGNTTVGMTIQRDDSPLPEVDPGLFADFSFGSNAGTRASLNSDENVDPSSPVSVAPTSLAPTPAPSFSSSTSSSGSPTPPLDPHMSVQTGTTDTSADLGAYMHLDGLYSPEAHGIYVPDHLADHPYSVGGDMHMYRFDVDPVVSSHMASPLEDGGMDLRTPTEACFGRDEIEGAYFESA